MGFLKLSVIEDIFIQNGEMKFTYTHFLTHLGEKM